MAYRVYISPSVQEWNEGVGDYGTEEERMQAVGTRAAEILRASGFIVFKNKPHMNLEQIVQESNSLAVDAHIAIHSNAGGGEGTEVWYQAKNTKSERLARCIYDEIAPLSPGKDRGIKPSVYYYELRRVKTPSVILEVAFHDNPKDAAWIIKSTEEIAAAIAKGICNYFGVKFQKPYELPEAKITVEGKPIKIPAVIYKDKVHIPITEVPKLYQFIPEWDNEEKTLNIRMVGKGDKT